MKKELYNWLNELLNIKPENFSEYFYDDIKQYLNFENELEFNEMIKQASVEKLVSLRNCKSKSEVKAWLDQSTSYIIKCLDVENILDDYIEGQ